MDWINPAYDINRWPAVVNMVINISGLQSVGISSLSK